MRIMGQCPSCKSDGCSHQEGMLANPGSGEIPTTSRHCERRHDPSAQKLIPRPCSIDARVAVPGSPGYRAATPSSLSRKLQGYLT